MNKRDSSKSKVIKKKEYTNIVSGKIYVLTTFNNTVISITNINGDVLFSASAGMYDLNKGKKKSTGFAAQTTATEVTKKALDAGMRNVEIIFRGISMNKEAIIRAIGSTGINILTLIDNVRYPHNGCRPRKARRG